MSNDKNRRNRNSSNREPGVTSFRRLYVASVPGDVRVYSDLSKSEIDDVSAAGYGHVNIMLTPELVKSVLADKEHQSGQLTAVPAGQAGEGRAQAGSQERAEARSRGTAHRRRGSREPQRRGREACEGGSEADERGRGGEQARRDP